MNQSFWDKVYSEKSEKEVSWFQEHPTKSLGLIDELNLSKEAAIIDIGGRDSRLVDHLLSKGFLDITVLDISDVSLQKLKIRLGDTGNKVKFITSDVTKFQPATQFDLWHDRAAFHFLTTPEQVHEYLEIVKRAIPSGGHLIISTFSKEGPLKCSGLPIHQYSQDDLKSLFVKDFNNTKCFEDTHVTPWESEQKFVYCVFKKK